MEMDASPEGGSPASPDLDSTEEGEFNRDPTAAPALNSHALTINSNVFTHMQKHDGRGRHLRKVVVKNLSRWLEEERNAAALLSPLQSLQFVTRKWVILYGQK